MLLQAAKYVGAGLATIGLAGAGAGIGTGASEKSISLSFSLVENTKRLTLKCLLKNILKSAL
jgi:F0F1-type ATP synthase membrane subunit c/vacuolar-type H+-ATPase subunit K